MWCIKISKWNSWYKADQYFQNNLKCKGWISLKFSQYQHIMTINNWFNFGIDPDHGLDPGSPLSPKISEIFQRKTLSTFPFLRFHASKVLCMCLLLNNVWRVFKTFALRICTCKQINACFGLILFVILRYKARSTFELWFVIAAVIWLQLNTFFLVATATQSQMCLGYKWGVWKRGCFRLSLVCWSNYDGNLRGFFFTAIQFHLQISCLQFQS